MLFACAVHENTAFRRSSIGIVEMKAFVLSPLIPFEVRSVLPKLNIVLKRGTLMLATATNGSNDTGHKRRILLRFLMYPLLKLRNFPHLLIQQPLRHLNRHLRPRNIRLRHNPPRQPNKGGPYRRGTMYVSHPAQILPNPERTAIKVTPMAPIRRTHSSVNERGTTCENGPSWRAGGRTTPRE